MALIKFTVSGPDNIVGLFAYESSAAVPVTGTYQSDKSPWIYIAPPGNSTQKLYFLGADYWGTSAATWESVPAIAAQKNYVGSATHQGYYSGTLSSSAANGFHVSASYISTASSTIVSPNDIIFIPRIDLWQASNNFQRVRENEEGPTSRNPSKYHSTGSYGAREFISLDKISSTILEILPVTIVSSLPSANSLRPSAFGNPEQRVTIDPFPPFTPLPTPIPFGFSSISGAYGKTRVSYSELNAAFSRFSIPMVPNSKTHLQMALSPVWQAHGMSLPRIVSEALMRILDNQYNSNGSIPLETTLDRDKLILRMTQMGVDLWSLYKSGKKSPWNPLWLGTTKNESFSIAEVNSLRPQNSLFTDINSQALVNSGHKALIMFAGLILSNQEMIDPDATFLALGDTSGTTAKARIFPENGFYYEAESGAAGLSSTWIGGKYAFQHTAVSSVIVVSGAGTASALTCKPGLRSYQSLSPTSVAGSALWNNSTLSANFTPANALELEGVVAASNLGTSLFMQCAKLTKQWSKTAVGGIRLHFLLPPNNSQSLRFPIFGSMNASSFTGYARNVYGASSVNEDYTNPMLNGELYFNPKLVVGAKTNFSNTTNVAFSNTQNNRSEVFSAIPPRSGNYGSFQYFRAGDGQISFLNSNHFELDARLFGNGITDVLPPDIELGNTTSPISNQTVLPSMNGGLLFTEDSIKWDKIRFQLVDAPNIDATLQDTTAVLIVGRPSAPRPYIWSGAFSGVSTSSISGTGGGLSGINGYSYVSKLAPYVTLEKSITVNKYGNHVIEIDLSAFDPDLATIGTPYFIPPGFENIAVQVFWPTTGYVSNALFMTVNNLN